MIQVLQSTQSVDTFFVTLNLLERMGTKAHSAAPAILRNAERLGLFKDHLAKKGSNKERVEKIAGTLEKICACEDTVSASLPDAPLYKAASDGKSEEQERVKECVHTGRDGVVMVNHRRVKMACEVGKCGPSGISSVELYMTRDDGLTWKRMECEFTSDTQNGEVDPGVLRRQVSVNLPEDGSYGFYLIAKSGAGLSEPAPRSGDTQHVRVKIDTQLPLADLYKPEEDPVHKDALLLRWKASDENLTATPISLQWAERSSGPWNSIGPEQMPNTGSYSWITPTNIPPQVYLRLTVRDTAGNVNVAETPEPVLIDLFHPKVSGIKIVGSE